MTVLIAGAGIAGLTMGLTLHQLGIPFHIFERIKVPKPLGVGINIQPTAVRELYALGLENELDQIGIQTRDYGFYTRTGIEIWTEQRGRYAGYNWPQYSVHRGQLQMLLLETLTKRCGKDCISLNSQVLDFHSTGSGVKLNLETSNPIDYKEGQFLIGADGIHSAIRKKIHPEKSKSVWSGAIMWRGTTAAKPFLSGASMILAGNDTKRFVSYPISRQNPECGLATINWIAEKSYDPSNSFEKEDWNRKVNSNRFLQHFEDWNFGWINIPELIGQADDIYEYPMVDLEPVDHWTIGNATLIGDAAHATYPVGSSGASQAILDARHLGASFRRFGIGNQAAVAYEKKVRPMANAVTMANRGARGPDAIMQIAEDRCNGDFSKIDDVLPKKEREAHAKAFRKLAGITVEDTNLQGAII